MMTANRICLGIGCVAVVGGAIAYQVSRNSAAFQVQDAAGDRVRVGGATLWFPDGAGADIGEIDSARVLEYAFAVVNESQTSVDLNQIRVATPCCTSARLLTDGVVLAPGARGRLRLRMSTGDRPGRNVSRVPMTWIGSSGGGTEPPVLFNLYLGYTLAARMSAAWGDAELDFGDVWSGAASVRREAELVVQYQSADKPVEFEVQPATAGLSVRSVGTRVDSGRFDDVATLITVACTLDGTRHTRGSYTARIIARSAEGTWPLPVRWRVVDEYLTFPEGRLHVPFSATQPVSYRLGVRNVAGHKFVIREASCTVADIEVAPLPDEAASEAAMILRPTGRGEDAADCMLRLTFVRDDGEPCTRELPIELVELP